MHSNGILIQTLPFQFQISCKYTGYIIYSLDYTILVMAEFFSKLPKIELHAHLNASLSADTIKELISSTKILGIPQGTHLNFEMVTPIHTMNCRMCRNQL